MPTFTCNRSASQCRSSIVISLDSGSDQWKLENLLYLMKKGFTSHCHWMGMFRCIVHLWVWCCHRDWHDVGALKLKWKWSRFNATSMNNLDLESAWFTTPCPSKVLNAEPSEGRPLGRLFDFAITDAESTLSPVLWTTFTGAKTAEVWPTKKVQLLESMSENFCLRFV